jgi:hypothetical protein
LTADAVKSYKVTLLKRDMKPTAFVTL